LSYNVGMKFKKSSLKIAHLSVIHEFVRRKQAVKELNRCKERLEEMVEERSMELSAVVERYRLFFRNSIDGMLILSADGTILEANPEACRLFGLGEDEVCGVGWEDLVFGEDTCFSQALTSCLPFGMFRGELTFRRKDGTTFPAFVSTSLFRNSDGSDRLSTVIRDISDLKRTEEALRASEAMLKEAQKIAHIGHWELNFVTNKLTWSEEVCNIYEVDPEQFESSFDAFFNLFSPKDKDKIDRTHTEAAHTKADLDNIHRFNFPDGRIKYVHETCRNFYDPAGKLTRTVGTVQDMTTSWMTEERLRQLSHVVEQSPVCVVITDVTGIITYVNPKFSELTGYDSHEVIGQNPRLLKSGLTPPETYEALWSSLLAGREWRGEFCNRKKDGGQYWEMASISPVANALGEITHFVAIKEDITERKIAEERLRELSVSDELTGLANRRGFLLLAQQQLKVAERTGKALVLLFADLDRLKWINDTLGHGEGDRAIQDAARILRDSFRASDIVARLGGDEFVALSPDAAEQSEMLIMNRLQEHLHAHNREAQRPYELSISFGITVYHPAEPCTLEELLERGDRLMYEQKQKRKQSRNE
jgi:diguanylate cyclase (GGDEF)-like protein/PAS domain S-box-containing protein